MKQHNIGDSDAKIYHQGYYYGTRKEAPLPSTPTHISFDGVYSSTDIVQFVLYRYKVSMRSLN